jgi:hypothetical protein
MYRLSVLDSDDTHHVMEFPDYASVVQAMLGQVPWHNKPKVMTVYELAPFEPSTWSQVAEGDEVWAPNNTVWTVEETVAAPGGVTAYRITNTLDPKQSTTTTPQPHAEVRRRPGPASQVRQMLLDAGIATTFVRQQ